MPIGPATEHIEGNGQVGRDGPDGGDHHAGAIINEKARRPCDPAGLTLSDV